MLFYLLIEPLKLLYESGFCLQQELLMTAWKSDIIIKNIQNGGLT